MCLTRGVANKGFCGMRSFVARFNFSCTLIGDLTRNTGRKRLTKLKTNGTITTDLKNGLEPGFSRDGKFCLLIERH